MKRKQLLLYMPVIHSGYVAMLSRHEDADNIFLLGDGFADLFPSMKKEIRALEPSLAALLVRTLQPAAEVSVLEPRQLPAALTGDTLILPAEEIMRELVAMHSLDSDHQVIWERSFLRWDRAWSKPQPVSGFTSHHSGSDEDRQHMAHARKLADRSSDWWRQVGAVLVLPDGSVSEGFNRHYPTEYSPYLDGDPRNEFSRGNRADLSTALHAEAGIVAEAARDGRSVSGGRLYVTTFPCPSCARIIAQAGIAACYFGAPYADLAGDQVLKAAGVALQWIPDESADTEQENTTSG